MSWATDGRGGGGGGGGVGAASKPKKYVRRAEGKTWEDPSLAGWPENDYRLFVGDLGNEVSDDVLANTFHQCARAARLRSPRARRAVHDRPPFPRRRPGRYASLAKAKVVRDKHTNKSKVLRSRELRRENVNALPLVLQGFGFVSFLDPYDCAKALREKNGKYIGNRPCKLRKSEVRRLRRYRAYSPPLSSSALCFAVAGTADRRSAQEGAPGQEDAKGARAPVSARPGAAVEVRIRIDRGALAVVPITCGAFRHRPGRPCRPPLPYRSCADAAT